MVKKVYDLGLPLNLHANGDAAIDLLLKAHEYAAAGDLSRSGTRRSSTRSSCGADQLDKYVADQSPHPFSPNTRTTSAIRTS